MSLKRQEKSNAIIITEKKIKAADDLILRVYELEQKVESLMRHSKFLEREIESFKKTTK